MEELQSTPTRPFGEFLRRMFENRDYLESHSDEELLESRPALPASARLQKQFAMSPEGWKLTSVDLQLGRGVAVYARVTAAGGGFCGGVRREADAGRDCGSDGGGFVGGSGDGAAGELRDCPAGGGSRDGFLRA